MATFKRAFGNNTPVTKADDQDTPQQKVEEAKTGVEVGAGVGDSQPVKKDTESVKKADQGKTPGGVNKDVWEQARNQVKDSFGGLDEKAQNDAIQARYDSMIASDKQVKAWAGDDPAILGDVGAKKEK